MKSSIRTTGAQWLQFYNDDSIWGSEGFHEDLLIEVNGEPESETFDDARVKPDDEVRVVTGVLMDSALGDRVYDIVTVFRSWNKRQLVTTVLVEVNSDQVEKLKEAIKDVVTAKVVTK